MNEALKTELTIAQQAWVERVLGVGRTQQEVEGEGVGTDPVELERRRRSGLRTELRTRARNAASDEVEHVAFDAAAQRARLAIEALHEPWPGMASVGATQAGEAEKAKGPRDLLVKAYEEHLKKIGEELASLRPEIGPGALDTDLRDLQNVVYAAYKVPAFAQPTDASTFQPAYEKASAAFEKFKLDAEAELAPVRKKVQALRATMAALLPSAALFNRIAGDVAAIGTLAADLDRIEKALDQVRDLFMECVALAALTGKLAPPLNLQGWGQKVSNVVATGKGDLPSVQSEILLAVVTMRAIRHYKSLLDPNNDRLEKLKSSKVVALATKVKATTASALKLAQEGKGQEAIDLLQPQIPRLDGMLKYSVEGEVLTQEVAT